eukprot:8683851-Karenia_brevis.AAC.1
MPGDLQLRNLWCMKKRNKPMVPAPHNSPMPDSQNSREAASRLYSIYMRPWTLDRLCATTDVPNIPMLNRIPYAWTSVDGKVTAVRARGKQPSPEYFQRSFARTWSWCARGNVVSEHSARLIKQLLAAC